ncbi:uncharacterized protein LOC121750270 [Salvia splendens]|uniref:uncharacterized protein LOC121750270 n=1 Tax=Salvia splendens TaxID=180675 RepID=UPI001C27D267|nr:uncharacterized protein LOC121750270 [Salvia splendens]XP_042000714.1 uncharacterized protein LOC121750270 [Salvia splendens]
MEALYSKLYDKYTKLKKEKEYQFDELNYEQEVKFLKYEAAADEMIQYLKSENEKLHEQHIHFQKLLAEENQKNKELCEEISRLQEKECSSYTMAKESGQENSHNTPGEQSQGTSPAKSSKKRKYVHISEHAAAPYVDVEVDHPSGQLVPRDKSSGVPSIVQQPACCLRTTNSSDTSSFNCMFQYLVEYVVGLKVSPVTKSNEVSILARHQSSGYSFSLTWITKADGEVELLYRVLSLGTFERVAPEWMKETLMFSSSMCSIFFQRVSRVINT